MAQYADWWNIPGGTAATYAHKLNLLRAHCADVGRDYDEIVKTWSADAIALAPSEAAAQAIAATSPYARDATVGTPDQLAEQLRTLLISASDICSYGW